MLLIIGKTALMQIFFYRALNDADECRESRINSAESTARPAIPIKPQQNPAENLLKIESISQDSIRMGIRLQWEKQSEIECYEIWRAKESEQPVKIKEGSFPIPRYQDYDVEANCCYTYAIRGLNESGKDIAHSADIQLIAPSKPPVFQIRELQFTFSGLQLKWSMLFEAEKIYCPEILGCLWMDNSCGASCGADHVSGCCRSGWKDN